MYEKSDFCIVLETEISLAILLGTGTCIRIYVSEKAKQKFEKLILITYTLIH